MKAKFISIMVAISLGTILAVFQFPKPTEDDAVSTTGVVLSPTIEALPASQSIGYPALMSPHTNPIALGPERLFVCNTPADTVDVINPKTNQIQHRISVGVDPVCVAIRPDAKEVWVANHVSDSISVIDNDPESPTFLTVIDTIQQFNSRTKATRFDEPMGIAFANSEKAYVALSSENEIAVVDVATRQIKKRLKITAQDPRAIRVHGDRLYVIPFESNNQTQLSGGNKDDIDGELVTFDAWDHSITHNNVLSLGHVTDIIKHPEVPDRDLFVFDTKTDKLIQTVDTLGTLLYGLTVDSKGRVFIAQTDARNDVNGRAGTKKHGLAELQNRAFLNQISVVLPVQDQKDESFAKDVIDLEPLPPENPDPNQAFATPFAIEVSADDSTLIATAAGSDKVFIVDVESGEVIGQQTVGSVPRGIAIENSLDGKLLRAWTYNAVENSVSVVSLTEPTEPEIIQTIELVDPTNHVYKRGRIAFNSANASSTGTFSCASCHPDGHTDQLLWVLKTPIVTGGNQIMPRSTMPLRGLRDTAPFHWDGVPGDPYGGINSQVIRGHVEPNCDEADPESTTRHLIDGALASTMALVGSKEKNDEGKPGRLSKADRDSMAKFLLDIPFPPAPQRAYTNVISERAKKGFELFHVLGDNDPTKAKPNVCGDCHRFPHLVSTNTPGTGMDAPTWRGAYDRWLILPQGRLNIIGFDFYRNVAEQGADEQQIWQFSWAGRRRFNPVWNMVLENSTGFSGAFGRQVTMHGDNATDESVHDLLKALETTAREGAIVLQVDGTFIEDDQSQTVRLQFQPTVAEGRYVEVEDRQAIHFGNSQSRRSYSRKELADLAFLHSFIGTFTGRHGVQTSMTEPQPAIWAEGPIQEQRGRQQFPILHPNNKTMRLASRYVRDGARVFVDGRLAQGELTHGSETLTIELDKLPEESGIHLLQIQNPEGMFSNDFIFHVVEDQQAALALHESIERNYDPFSMMAKAIRENDLTKIRELVKAGNDVNARHPDTGVTPLSDAATFNRLEIGEFLILKGAKVKRTNRDGNTPMHSAAFFCYPEFAKLLLEHDADIYRKSQSGSSPLSSVTSDWTDELEGIYKYFNRTLDLGLNLETLKRERPKMAKLLRGE